MFVQQRNTHHNNALRLKFTLIYNFLFLYATCNGFVGVLFFLCVYLEAFSANLWIIDASVNVVDREVTLAHNNLLMLAV